MDRNSFYLNVIAPEETLMDQPEPPKINIGPVKSKMDFSRTDEFSIAESDDKKIFDMLD